MVNAGMHDRPTVDELLRAVEVLFDEQLVPTLTARAQYNARVAANVIRTVRRELQHEERQLEQEWAGLDVVLGPTERPSSQQALRRRIAERTEELSERIRAGDADEGEWRRLVVGAPARRRPRQARRVQPPLVGAGLNPLIAGPLHRRQAAKRDGAYTGTTGSPYAERTDVD